MSNDAGLAGTRGIGERSSILPWILSKDSVNGEGIEVVRYDCRFIASAMVRRLSAVHCESTVYKVWWSPLANNDTPLLFQTSVPGLNLTTTWPTPTL